jgi:hypothetical protein
MACDAIFRRLGAPPSSPNGLAFDSADLFAWDTRSGAQRLEIAPRRPLDADEGEAFEHIPACRRRSR